MRAQNRRAGRALVLSAAALWLLPAIGQAHALLHEVVDGDAVIVRLSYPGTDGPRFQPYEVMGPDDEKPFQSGHTNAFGEISFRPDRPGAWRVRVFTEDGHGAVIELELDAAGTVAGARGHHGVEHGYWLRVAAALGYLAGAFGLLAIWRRRRPRAWPA